MNPSIEQRLRDLIALQLPDVDPESVTPEWIILDDPSAVDSLDYVELIMAIEEEFNLTIWDEDAEQAKTFQQLLEMVTKYTTGELPK